MLRVDLGRVLSLLLLKVPRRKYIGSCELDFPAERSNPRLEQYGICAFYSRRRPFTRDGLHPAPSRSRIGKVRGGDGSMETLPLIERNLSKDLVVGGDRFQQFGR